MNTFQFSSLLGRIALHYSTTPSTPVIHEHISTFNTIYGLRRITRQLHQQQPSMSPFRLSGLSGRIALLNSATPSMVNIDNVRSPSNLLPTDLAAFLVNVININYTLTLPKTSNPLGAAQSRFRGVPLGTRPNCLPYTRLLP